MRRAFVLALSPLLALAACTGTIGDADHSGSAIPGNQAGPGGATAAGGAANAGGAGNGPAAGPGLLPARIRRLTNAEFDASVKALLGIDSTFGQGFTPDTRQDGFTRNDAQRVDPVFITQLDDAAQQLAANARNNIAQLAPCTDPNGSEACARTFLTSFATRAYRRPATPREIDALVTVYKAGIDSATYADGIQATIQAVLESPGFLYVTELGDTPLAASVKLTDYEIGNQLSYLITGGPPDDQLLASAKAGELGSSDKRQAHLERLLGQASSGPQITRLIEEWLGVDQITQTAKDSNAYPDFAALRDAMKKEADDFTSEVMWKNAGSVSDLLSADWTIAGDSLARMYLNLQPSDPVPISGNHVALGSVHRRGILDQGAFLSVYAHANESGPVLRGVAVLRRIACDDIPSPQSLNIVVVPPVADPTKTTRERFAAHVSDPACAQCHTNIDSVGFTFENLDGMGRQRLIVNGVPTENGRPVDTSTTIMAGYEFDGNYADSAALAAALGQSSDVRACFARHVFRYAATRSDVVAKDAEGAFMSLAYALPPASQGKVKDILTAFVRSDAFVTRKASQ